MTRIQYKRLYAYGDGSVCGLAAIITRTHCSLKAKLEIRTNTLAAPLSSSSDGGARLGGEQKI